MLSDLSGFGAFGGPRAVGPAPVMGAPTLGGFSATPAPSPGAPSVPTAPRAVGPAPVTGAPTLGGFQSQPQSFTGFAPQYPIASPVGPAPFQPGLGGFGFGGFGMNGFPAPSRSLGDLSGFGGWPSFGGRSFF